MFSHLQMVHQFQKWYKMKKSTKKRLKQIKIQLNKLSDKLTTLDIAVDRLGYDFNLLKINKTINVKTDELDCNLYNIKGIDDNKNM